MSDQATRTDAAASATIGSTLRDHINNKTMHGGASASGDDAVTMTLNDDGTHTIRGKQPFAVTLPTIKYEVSVNGQSTSEPTPAPPPPPAGTGYMGGAPAPQNPAPTSGHSYEELMGVAPMYAPAAAGSSSVEEQSHPHETRPFWRRGSHALAGADTRVSVESNEHHWNPNAAFLAIAFIVFMFLMYNLYVYPR